MKIKPEELNMVVIEKETVEKYIDFSDLIKSTLEHPEYFENYTKKDLIKLLDNGSYIYLYKYHDFALASSMLIKLNKSRMKEFDLDFEEESGIELGPQAVFQDIRENGVQKYLMKKMEEIAKNKNYKYILAIIHKDDNTTNSNIKKLNYGIVKEQKEKIIYKKDLVNEVNPK